jgi:hypothetical protein
MDSEAEFERRFEQTMTDDILLDLRAHIHGGSDYQANRVMGRLMMISRTYPSAALQIFTELTYSEVEGDQESAAAFIKDLIGSLDPEVLAAAPALLETLMQSTDGDAPCYAYETVDECIEEAVAYPIDFTDALMALKDRMPPTWRAED